MSHYRRFNREFPKLGHSVQKLEFDCHTERRWGDDEPAPVNNYYAPPPAPAAPSASQSMAEYAAAMPQIYETQLQYQPKFAQMSKMISEQLYPETAKIQENLAPQALAQANTQQLPQWMQDQYSDAMRAQLGTNVSSPIGADMYGRGMLGLTEDYRNQGWNKAMALAGRQQLTQAPTMAETIGGYTPQAILGYNAQNYGTQMSGYNAGLGYSTAANNASLGYNSNIYQSNMGLYGQLGSAAISGIGGVAGLAMLSSERYKKNITLWE